MKKNLISLVSTLFIFTISFAQMPTGGRTGGNQQNMNMGRFNGKVLDNVTNKAVEGASVQLFGKKYDQKTKKTEETILATVIIQANGDFIIENLPVIGKFKLVISAIGYKTITEEVSFEIKVNGADGADKMTQMLNAIDKDLGNFKMELDAANLGNVTVTAAKNLFEMGVDRKIFNVDKNIISSGQMATEVMKQIPSVSVDIDGNVTVRNATPQVFVDGRPTTLTLDQIPADIIDKIELITNPSAKFDASGGNAGIINVVLKKNKKTGYNGGLRTGVDSRGRINLGGDLNVRQGKINFSLNGMFNQRKSLNWTNTDRLNNTVIPSQVVQYSEGMNKGYFAFLRGGIDYVADIRNTFSLNFSLNRGNFNNTDDQNIDSTINSIFNSYSQRNTATEMNFKNFGSQLSYKHLFPKVGHEISADVNYNSSNNTNEGFFNTNTFYPSGIQKGNSLLQKTLGAGTNKFLTFQTDYENALTEKSKLELGARVAIRDFENNNEQFFYNHATYIYDKINSISANYSFTDKVYAAYGTYSIKTDKWSYQLGLRAESSNYNGKIAGKDSSFLVDFPISLFPSLFITNKLTDKQDLQLNFSRRINRPNFFQLMPFVDYTDPQNLNVGNANLKPEFTNSFELSYNNSYKRGANFLVSAFYKYNTNLITRYQYKSVSPLNNLDSVIFNTYANANSSSIYGIELTNKMEVIKNWDMTINVNLFNSKINGSNIQSDLTNESLSWFAKWNNSIKIGKDWSLQLSADYYAKTVMPQEGGRSGGRGGMMHGGTQPTAQGFILPRYSFDIAIKKDWKWKDGQSGSLTLSMNDFARTQLYSTETMSDYFSQVYDRRRDPQVLRLNFSYRFGKFDTGLFKRKNNKTSGDDGSSMMGVQ